MSEFSHHEKQMFLNCITKVASDLASHKEIIAQYKGESDQYPSFDYLYFLSRLEVACSIGPKALNKAIQEMQREIRGMGQFKIPSFIQAPQIQVDDNHEFDFAEPEDPPF